LYVALAIRCHQVKKATEIYNLSTYKSASAFSKVYEMMPDFWEQPHRRIEDYADGKRDGKARYLIAEKVSLQGVGFIELDYSNLEMPEVDIAVLEEYQGKGYAFEASKILFVNVFENESVKCIVWNAFRSNKASCRIAEKLGGKVVLHPASSQTITGYSLANLIRASCVLNCQLIFAHSALRLTVHIRTCCLKLSKSGHGFPNAWRLMMPISISAMSSQLPCFGV
jgi:RimJ/RimL family protein N-acetyltransferase